MLYMVRNLAILVFCVLLAGVGIVTGEPTSYIRGTAKYDSADLINLVQWLKADGGNDHWYAVYPVTTHWQGAKAAVEALVQDSLPGHLATISSAEENQFITTHVLT